MRIHLAAWLHYPDGWDSWSGLVNVGGDSLPPPELVDRLFQEELLRTADEGYTHVDRARAFASLHDESGGGIIWSIEPSGIIQP